MADGSRDMDATGPSSNRTQWGAICAQKCTVPEKKWQFTVARPYFPSPGESEKESEEGVDQMRKKRRKEEKKKRRKEENTKERLQPLC